MWTIVEKNYTGLEVWGPSGARLLAGGPSGFLTLSFRRSARVTHVVEKGSDFFVTEDRAGIEYFSSWMLPGIELCQNMYILNIELGLVKI